MSRKFNRRAISLSMFGILALALQGTTKPAYAYDINVILPLTGGASFLGKSEQKALQLAEPIINKAGGIKGQPVHFEFYDDQSNPQTGVQLVESRDRRQASGPVGIVAGRGLQRDGAADAGRPGDVLLLARHSSAGRKLRLHFERLDPRPRRRDDPLFPAEGVDEDRVHDQRRRHRPGRRARPGRGRRRGPRTRTSPWSNAPISTSPTSASRPRSSISRRPIRRR